MSLSIRGISLCVPVIRENLISETEQIAIRIIVILPVDLCRCGTASQVKVRTNTDWGF